MDLRDRRNDRTRVAARRVLLDGDGRGQAFDLFDIWLLKSVQELPRISRERLHITALTFRVQRIKRKRRLTRARKPRDDRQRIPRNRHVDPAEVVHIGLGNYDIAHHCL